MSQEVIDNFCNIAERRSEENIASFKVLYKDGLYGQCFSVFRQELDTMVRMIYILHFTDNKIRLHLMSQTLKGEKWSLPTPKGKLKIITDKEMVEIADSLTGWSEYVYKFGCGIIHLSNLHNYKEDNPFAKLSTLDKDNIIQYMRQYHYASFSRNSTMEEFVEYLPKVMDKISGNLKCDIDSVRGEKALDWVFQDDFK